MKAVDSAHGPWGLPWVSIGVPGPSLDENAFSGYFFEFSLVS